METKTAVPLAVLSENALGGLLGKRSDDSLVVPSAIQKATMLVT